MSLYDILDLTPSATYEEIKHAYKKLAMKYHPDKNRSPDAEQRFKQIALAYSTLSNEQKRHEYDRSLEQHPNLINFLFEMFRPSVKAPIVTYNLYLTLEQIYHGHTTSRTITRTRNNKYEEHLINITVPPGAAADSSYLFPSQGDSGAGLLAGDIVFILREVPHEKYVRSGNNLCMIIDITLAEAIAGFTRTVQLISGTNETINSPALKTSTDSLTVPNGGMPTSTGYGDLIIDVNIDLQT